jgi:alkylation response protein AidB-like acyl-CoA dehydrogenase
VTGLSFDFTEELARRIAKAGLNGIGVPEEYGGQGGDLLDQTIVCEELSRTLGGLAWLWGITVWSGARAILHHGNAAQKESYLPAVASGDLRFAFAMTEPAGGTDVLRAMTTKASPADGGYVLHGTKIWSMKLETARLLTYRGAWLEQNGKPSGVAATTAKCLTSEWAVESADFGIQVLGGYGYRQRIADELAGASVTAAPPLSRA